MSDESLDQFDTGEASGTALILNEETLKAIQQQPGEPQAAAGDHGKSAIQSGGVMPSIEEVAKEMGWNPNYNGKDKVDAVTFMKNTVKMQRQAEGALKVVKKQVEDLTEGIQVIKSVADRQRLKEVAALKKQIEQLREDKKDAVRQADEELVDTLDKQIDDLEEQVFDEEQTLAQQQAAGGNLKPEFVDWKEKNTWYGDEDEPELNALADSIAQKGKENGLTLDAVLRKIDRECRDIYPEKFDESYTPPERRGGDKPLQLGKSGRGTQSQPTFGEKDLTSGQRKVMEQAMSQGMTKEQYLNGLRSQRAAGGVR